MVHIGPDKSRLFRATVDQLYFLVPIRLGAFPWSLLLGKLELVGWNLSGLCYSFCHANREINCFSDLEAFLFASVRGVDIASDG